MRTRDREEGSWANTQSLLQGKWQWEGREVEEEEVEKEKCEKREREELSCLITGISNCP